MKIPNEANLASLKKGMPSKEGKRHLSMFTFSFLEIDLGTEQHLQMVLEEGD